MKWIAAIAVSACTLESKSASEDAGSDDETQGDTSSDDGTATTTGSSATSATVSATGSEETTDGLECPGYVSTPDIGPVVDVALRVEKTAPIWLASSGCFASPELDIVGPGEVVIDHRIDECASTCDEILSGEDNLCFTGCPDCGSVTGERLEPGADETARWLGRSHAIVDIVPSCTGIADETCPPTCKVADQAAAGTYELSLTVYRSCTGACECDGDPLPACGLYGEVELGEPEVYTVTIDYPAQTTAEIVITD
jgi:hypothetical protein